MNEQWVNWILLSIFKHFQDDVTGYPFYVPCQELPKDIAADRYELIYMGPDFHPQTNNEWKITIIINVAVITNKVHDNPSAHFLMVGKALKFFDRCIKVYKYGASQDQSQLPYTLDLESPVRVTDIGLFDPVSRQQRSTIEAQYTMQIS